MAFNLAGYLCTFVIAYVASRMIRSFLSRMGETAARAILAMLIVWAVGVALVTAQAPNFDPEPALMLVTPPIVALLAVDLLLLGRRRRQAAKRGPSRGAAGAAVAGYAGDWGSVPMADGAACDPGGDGGACH